MRRPELGERRFDLLVIGGGIVGAGIAAHAAAHRPRCCARRPGRLRRRDLERVVEADPRRPPLPAPRRRPARPRGAPRAARAHERRRAAPRPPHAVPPAALRARARSGPAFVQSGIVALLGARPLAAQLARPRRRGRARWCRRSGRTASARARSTPTPGRTTPGSASRTCARRPTRARPSSTTPRSSRSTDAAAASPARRCSVDGDDGRGRGRAAVVNATGPWVDHVRRLEDAVRRTVRAAQQGRARARAERGAAGRRR